jgi:hypothetical protein
LQAILHGLRHEGDLRARIDGGRRAQRKYDQSQPSHARPQSVDISRQSHGADEYCGQQ